MSACGGRNPLTGLSGLQHGYDLLDFEFGDTSQSPYRAKWFATRAEEILLRLLPQDRFVAIPLRG